MMKLTFGKVLEFVRAGEDDPRMAEQLQRDPDGQELLEEARLLRNMMDWRSRRRDNHLSFDSAVVAESRELPDMPGDKSPDERIQSSRLSKSMPMRPRPTPRPRIMAYIEPSGSSREDLGTLTGILRGKSATLSFRPGPAAKAPDDDLFSEAVTKGGSLEVQGAEVNLRIAGPVNMMQPFSMQVTHARRNEPAANVEIIFMPDTGPFVRARSDREGNVVFERPMEPGVLRIEGHPTQRLRIKLDR